MGCLRSRLLFLSTPCSGTDRSALRCSRQECHGAGLARLTHRALVGSVCTGTAVAALGRPGFVGAVALKWWGGTDEIVVEVVSEVWW